MKRITQQWFSIKLVPAFFILTALLSAGFTFQHAIAADVSSVPGAAQSPSPKSTSDDLLDPAEAFRPQIRTINASTVEIKIDIAPGYYLYRQRLRVDEIGETPSTPAGAGAPVPKRFQLTTSAGKMINDPTFGRVEIYEKSVALIAKLPKPDKKIGTALPAQLPTEVTFISQGCAKAGVCFPPQRQRFVVTAKAPGDQAASAWSLPAQDNTSLGFGQSTRQRFDLFKPAQ